MATGNKKWQLLFNHAVHAASQPLPSLYQHAQHIAKQSSHKGPRDSCERMSFVKRDMLCTSHLFIKHMRVMLTELVHQALKKQRHLDNMWTIWSCRKRESQLESHSFHADISQQPHPAVSSPLQSKSRQCGPEHQDWHHSWHSPSLPDACYASMLQCDPSLHISSQAKEVAEICRSLAWRYNFLHVNLQVSASTTWQPGFLHPIPISMNAFRMLCWIQCPLCALTLFVYSVCSYHILLYSL